MKKIITTLAFALLLTVQSQAQSCDTTQEASKPSPDAKLISTTERGNNRVSTWLVKKSSPNENNEFSVKYKVNLAKLISTYDNNHEELVKLRAFMDGLMADKQNQIVGIAITGYASPDGSLSTNENLSNARATDCCKYIKKEFPQISDVKFSTKGIAQPWSATKDAVESSSIPMKSEVLKLIDSDMNASQIETRLRAMPSAWSYLASSILPPMRCVEINIVYNTWEKVITRTPIRPQVEDVVIENNYFVIVDEDPSQLISFENSNAPLDFEKDRDRFKYRDRRRRAKYKEELHNDTGRHKYIWKSR